MKRILIVASIFVVLGIATLALTFTARRLPVDECRSTCLWYQRLDYYPRTDLERWRVLDAIQKHADLKMFQHAGRLKKWLSRSSSGASAG